MTLLEEDQEGIRNLDEVIAPSYKMSSLVKKLAEGEVESVDLSDVTCPICLSLMMEPVKMPCDHVLCHGCFTKTVNNANLVCPICRLRISVWCRRATKVLN